MTSLEPIIPLCEEHRGPAPLVLAWTLGSTAIILIILRVIDKKHFGNGLALDDYTMVAAVFFSTLDNISLTKLSQSGLGRHLDCLTFEDISNLLRWITMSELAQVVALALAKISVCLSVQRVLAKTTYSFSFLPRTLIGVIIVFHTLHFCLFALYCRPMQAIWDPLVPGNCYSVQTIVKISYAVTALDIFTDLLCAGLPVFVISRLQMNKKSKAAICILVSLGILTACSAVGKAVTYGDFRIEDASWTATTPALWVVAESQLSMNLPSFPAMRSLYLHLRQPTKGGRTDPKSLQRNDHHRLLDKLNYKVYNSSLPEGDHNPTFHTSEQLERDVENNHHLTGRITIRS